MDHLLYYLSLRLPFLLLGIIMTRIVLCCWVLPCLAYTRLTRHGLRGPPPSFPLGNINEMKTRTNYTLTPHLNASSTNNPPPIISHDIHPTLFPYFARWHKSYGKVYVYWLGTEPFLYIAEPEFLRKMSAGVMGKTWGKPDVFKHDREPMFGKGLVMVEGDDWLRHRRVITPAFSPTNLKAMTGIMVERTKQMLDKWALLINSGTLEIDVEREVTATAGEIIAAASFGLCHEIGGATVFEKLRAMQMTLFDSNRYVGVPLSKFLSLKRNLRAKELGREIDQLLLGIINARKGTEKGSQRDFLGLLLAASGGDGRRLTTRELVDECKTFFFGGHETTALAVAWTLLLLAQHQEWQEELREEIRDVVGDKEVDFNLLAGLKKMGWVMNEVLRLYPPAPNAQRQAREDIKVDNIVIPRGTNMWIDIVSMHHDRSLWGDDVNEFQPERFSEDGRHGECKHKMGFLPFGFGGRMCVGRNFTVMEYKVVLMQALSRFSFSLSPSYSHSPTILLSLRPKHGLPLVVRSLE